MRPLARTGGKLSRRHVSQWLYLLEPAFLKVRSTPMFENVLEGRVALVTGGDSGIGAACAIALAAAGADVALTYLEDEKGAENSAHAIADHGRRALPLRSDVRQEVAVETCFDVVGKQLGTPDVLVNSAGINMVGLEVAEMTLAHWEDMIRTDLTGTFLTCRRFVQDLRAAKRGGTIINITSIHADVMRAGGAEYMASKGGQKNLTQTLALEVATDGITVNAIAPGMILTPMNQAAKDHWVVRKVKSEFIPLKRAGKPEEVANVAVFLASPAGAYFTGTTLTIDGGLSLMLALGA
jgi:glucose 1-dehydrogenase